jgi:exopolyphosphatase/pppGpp-phosphohydrolase
VSGRFFSFLIFSLLLSSVLFAENLHNTGLVCAADLGSNTFKFIVSEIKDGQYKQDFDQRRPAGVGDDVNASQQKTGRKQISAVKIKEIESLLAAFQDECEQRTHSRKIHAIATAAFREAENRNDVLDALLKQGVAVQILSPKEESMYAYDVATLGDSGFGVVDLGSRTTEFVTKTGSEYRWAEISTGYKTAWDAFYINARTFQQAAAAHLKKLKETIIEKEFEILSGHKELRVVEVGESSSYLLGIPQNQIEGKVVTKFNIERKLNELSRMDAKSFAALKNSFKDAPKVLPRLVLIDLILERTRYKGFRGTDHELNVAIIYKLSRLRNP